MLRALMVVLLCAPLASCSASGLMSKLTGSGVSVAANTQAGQSNIQAIGNTSVANQRLVKPQANVINQTADKNQLRAEHIENLFVNQTTWWELSLMLFFAVMDSPLRWPGQIWNGLVRIWDRKRS